ncbi:P-selectin-like [Sycon ciliatum]|uniref:P-selectin-like n=1 Tax=Sycon ciliatum TaxID=27933 RepID=UPI0031F662C0
MVMAVRLASSTALVLVAINLLSLIPRAEVEAFAWTQCANSAYEYQHQGSTLMTFDSAVSFCKAKDGGAYLAIPRNAVEDACICNLLSNTTAWLGIRKLNGIWMDIEARLEVHYTNWEVGEPSTDSRRPQHCVTMWYVPDKGKGDQWDNLQCGWIRRVVCQRKGITCMAPPPALANSSILSQELVYPGIVTYQCDVGYYVAGYAEQNVSNATVQCAPNGTWIGTPPTCLPIMCPDLPNTLENGSVRVLSFGLEYTNNRTYTCQHGFFISSAANFSVTSVTMHCLLNGSWSAPVPTCKRITCVAPPPALANSSILSLELVYPGVVTYQCDVGYYVAGYAEQNVSNATVQCAPNGTWIGTPPTCLPIMCPDLPNTHLNGSVRVLSVGLEYTNNRTYTCQHGFFISSAANFSVTSVTMHCLLNGSWSAPVPTCKLLV